MSSPSENTPMDLPCSSTIGVLGHQQVEGTVAIFLDAVGDDELPRMLAQGLL
jgi:hypothetical protein